jgi:glycosyltransferase involved in cell wall biosynthesis
MSPIRVAHHTSVHAPFDVRIFHKECQSLSRAGNIVTVFAPGDCNEVVDGVRIISVPKPKGRLSRMTGTAWRLYRAALQQPAEVYHFHDPELIPIGLLLRLRGSKVIYDVHEDMPRNVLSKDYLPQWLRKPLAWVVGRIEEFACRHFSGVVAATPAIARRLERYNPRTYTINNFARPEEFGSSNGLPWNERAQSVVYVGGVDRRNCIGEIVEALSMLPESLAATLKLLGRFDSGTLRTQVSQHAGWARVEELGLVSRAKVREVLGQVRVGLVVCAPDPDCVDSMPNKMFEYMAAGLPIIASDFPLWREIVRSEGCGLLVDPLNPRTIAEAIEYLLTHPEEAQGMGSAGREAVEERYNWGIEEKKLLALYANLAEMPD